MVGHSAQGSPDPDVPPSSAEASDHILSPNGKFKGLSRATLFVFFFFSRATLIWGDVLPSERCPWSQNTGGCSCSEMLTAGPHVPVQGWCAGSPEVLPATRGGPNKRIPNLHPQGRFPGACVEWATYMCRDFCAFTTSSFEL